MSWEFPIVFSMLLLFPTVMAVAAVTDGSASGWIEVKGQRVELKYVFAAMSEDELEGQGKEKIEVLLSDKPVMPELRKATGDWMFWAAEQAQKGEMHGVVLYINPETKAWTRGQRLTSRGLQFYSVSVSSPELSDLVFTPTAAGPGELAGKVSMKKPMSGMDEEDGAWKVTAEFRTSIVMRPAITATLTGAEALKSGPYQAVQEHVAACRKKDLEAIRKTLNANARQLVDKFIEAQGKDVVMQMFAAEAAETAKAKLQKIIVRGDTAEIILKGGDDSTQTLRAVLENGVWKYGH